MLGSFHPMMMSQRNERDIARMKESVAIRGKNLRYDGDGSKDLASSSMSEAQYSQSVQGSTGTQTRQEMETAAPSLQGATNGTVGAYGNMMGDQFSSAGQEVSRPYANNAPYSSIVNNDAVSMPPPAASPPVASFAAKAKLAADGDYRVAARARDEFSPKEEVAEKKQISSKRDSEADDEYSDDEGGFDAPADEAGQATFNDKSAVETSPVVPESDTYILLGVGMLVLGYALQNRKKVRVKKA